MIAAVVLLQHGLDGAGGGRIARCLAAPILGITVGACLQQKLDRVAAILARRLVQGSAKIATPLPVDCRTKV